IAFLMGNKTFLFGEVNMIVIRKIVFQLFALHFDPVIMKIRFKPIGNSTVIGPENDRVTIAKREASFIIMIADGFTFLLDYGMQYFVYFVFIYRINLRIFTKRSVTLKRKRKFGRV